MKYLYTYSGSQAAFVFSGLAILSKDVPALIEEDVHKQLQKNKFAKHLLETGELEVEEIADDEPKKSGRGGKGGKQNDAATDASKTADEAALADVKAELTSLGITFADDETLEQLQAKLAQSKE